MGLLFAQWLNMCIVVDILGVALFFFFFFLEVLFRKVCPGVENISVVFFFSFFLLCLSMNLIFLKRED